MGSAPTINDGDNEVLENGIENSVRDFQTRDKEPRRRKTDSEPEVVSPEDKTYINELRKLELRMKEAEITEQEASIKNLGVQNMLTKALVGGLTLLAGMGVALVATSMLPPKK